MKKFIFSVLLHTIFFVFDCFAMSWEFANENNQRFSVSFFPKKFESLGLAVDLVMRSDKNSIECLSKASQNLFEQSENDLVYSNFGNHEDYDFSRESDDDSDDVDKAKSFGCVPMDRRLVCSGTPKRMSCRKLREIIETRKIIFYTGAGISAEVIPTMNNLMQRLKISKELNKSDNLPKYIDDMIANPKKYTEILRDFFDRCENAQPTTAHVQLARCAKKFSHMLVTENLDQLHQKTGIELSVFGGRDKYSQNIRIKKAVREADFVITIGLNSDESGFLEFYKKKNPKGVIISVNLSSTNYLSDHDFWVEGDIQTISYEIF